MSSRPRIIAVHGNSFDGGVMPAGPIPSAAPAAATVPTKPIDERITRCSEGLAALQGENRARVQSWLLARVQSNREGDAILSLIAELAHKGFIAQHEAKLEECRAARTEKANLEAKITELNQELQKQRGKTFIAASRLDQAKANLVALDPWASRKERDAAQQAAEEAEKQWITERDAEAPFVERLAFLNLTEKIAATKKLNELSAEELRLRCLISGEPFVDQTYGIQVPGR